MVGAIDAVGDDIAKSARHIYIYQCGGTPKVGAHEARGDEGVGDDGGRGGR